MRIAIVCQNFPPASFEGGISHYSKVLAEHLKSRGHDVYAFTSTEFTESIPKSKIRDGIEVITVKGPWNHTSVKRIKKQAAKKKVDCLILQYSPASYKRSFRIMWAITRFTEQKITAFHTLWGKGLDRLLGLSLLIGSSKIIATNSEIMTILERRLPFILKKTYWIPIGSNIANVKKKLYDKNSEIPLFSYFGMLYPGKGLDLILDVLIALKTEKCRFQFKFIGGGMLDHDSYENKFQKKLKSLNLDDCVEHLGLIAENEVSKWLNKSRFVFLPYETGLSDRRGSFMAAIEHGKAVLTSAPVINMGFLKNGHNVIYPENPSLGNYVGLIKLLLRDDKLIKILEKGARKLSYQFKWQTIAKEYEMVIQFS